MSKLVRQNVGGTDYTMVGCALTGVCASSADAFIKDVTLSDGDVISDGMTVVVTFANGNTAGNAPNAQTIYSSDQTHYFSDSGLTQPVTLAPEGCYTITYTGSGNAYAYISYPVIQVGSVSGPLCDSCGKKTSGAVWDAGDTVLMVYTGSIFMTISGLTNSVIKDSKKAATSAGVYRANNAISGYAQAKNLSSVGWYKIIVGGKRNETFNLELNLCQLYNNNPPQTNKISIEYSWLTATTVEIASSGSAVTTEKIDKIAIAYNSNNSDSMAIYIHYNSALLNGVYFNFSSCDFKGFSSQDFIAENPSDTYANVIEIPLHTSGVYVNGQSYNIYNLLNKTVMQSGSTSQYIDFDNLYSSVGTRTNIFTLTFRNNESYILVCGTTDGAVALKPILYKISDLVTNNSPAPSANKLQELSYDLANKIIRIKEGSYTSANIRQICGTPIDISYSITATESFTNKITPSSLLALPTPTTDGDYALQCNVSSGVPSYRWVGGNKT
jgi:hypothetical protein